jgi:hypothetical protein
VNDSDPSIDGLKRMTIERSAEEIAQDGHICARCQEPFIVPSELEPTTVCDICAQWFVSDAAPVLLEIAEAALDLEGELRYMQGPASEKLRTALAKVRS